MLTEFSKGVLDEGFGSPRVIITLPKLAKAIARLKLKNVVDGEDANEVMEFYKVLLVKFQKNVAITKNPKDLAFEKGLDIVKRFEKFGGVSLEELIEIMCKEERQLAIHFGYGEGRSLKMSQNSKVRYVYKLLKRHPNITIKDEKPVVLKWLNDTYDTYDKDKILKNIKNEEKNNVKINDNKSEQGSHISYISHSKEEEKQQEEQKYGIKLGIDSKLPIHEITQEQFKGLNRNSKDNEGDDDY